MSDTPAERKRQRQNELVKFWVTTCNAIGLGLLAVTVLTPYGEFEPIDWFGTVIGSLICAMAFAILYCFQR